MKTALLLVDVQNDFFPGDSRKALDEMAANGARIVSVESISSQ